jgi:hypothetical protein
MDKLKFLGLLLALLIVETTAFAQSDSDYGDKGQNNQSDWYEQPQNSQFYKKTEDANSGSTTYSVDIYRDNSKSVEGFYQSRPVDQYDPNYDMQQELQKTDNPEEKRAGVKGTWNF